MRLMSIDNKQFHEVAINKVIAILKGLGELTGETVPPSSSGDRHATSRSVDNSN